LYPGERPYPNREDLYHTARESPYPNREALYHTTRESPYPIIHERHHPDSYQTVPEGYYPTLHEGPYLPEVPYQNFPKVTYQVPPEPHQSFHQPVPYQLQVPGLQNPVGSHSIQPASNQPFQTVSNSPNQSLSDLIPLDNYPELFHSGGDILAEGAHQLEANVQNFDTERTSLMGDVEDRVNSTASTLVETSPPPVRRQCVEHGECKT
jgi:hypothetical protein